MKILIADDDRASCRLLGATLQRLDYEVEAYNDGTTALEGAERKDAPRLLILDWMMPGHTGVEICRRLRNQQREDYCYIILLTTLSDKQDIIRGLEAGADDYLTKPFDPSELRARLLTARRILSLQDQVRESEKRLQQAEKAKAIGQLVGGVAHHFNNLLAGMLGNVYLVGVLCKENPYIMEKLNTVDRLGQRAAELIRQLLVSASKGIMQRREFMLTPFVRDTVEAKRGLWPSNVVLDTVWPSDALLFYGDSSQLQSAIEHLLDNAIQAVANTQAPKITIGLALVAADRQFCENKRLDHHEVFAHLRVSDNGSGIPAHLIDRVMEPFFTTRQVGQGQGGLGLSLSEGMARMHGGALNLESREGEGTTVHLWLPVKRSATRPVAPSGDTRAIRGHGETILLADDDPFVRDMSTKVLESLGFRVIAADSGRAAVQLFESNRAKVAVVVLDIVMPSASGLAAGEKIRLLAPHVPLLFMTGYNLDEVLGDSHLPTNSKLLAKPFSVESLSHQLHELLAG